eukprot:TCONS_00072852-protein
MSVSNEFTVLSWNIDGVEENCLHARTEAVIKYIEDTKPTIVMLQEVVPQSFTTLVTSLSTLYDVRSISNEGYFNVMLFLKHSSVELNGTVKGDFFQNTRMGRHYLLQRFQIHKRSVAVITSHLESLGDGSKRRQNQLKFCLQKMIQSPNDYNVIFSGDMNLRDYEVQNLGGLPVILRTHGKQWGKTPQPNTHLILS